MSVELVPHIGKNVVTKKVQAFRQYLVYDTSGNDREWIGIIGWDHGSSLIFMVPVDPIRQERIRDQVNLEIKREAEIISRPDLTEDQINPPQQEQDDDIDESYLT